MGVNCRCGYGRYSLFLSFILESWQLLVQYMYWITQLVVIDLFSHNCILTIAFFAVVCVHLRGVGGIGTVWFYACSYNGFGLCSFILGNGSL